MLGENLDKLKEFEKALKECLIKRFGAFLPEKKISQLYDTKYILGNELDDATDRNSIQGKIFRRMLDSLIDVTCIKEISVDGQSESTLIYGRDLEDGIIEYYIQTLAPTFRFEVDKIPELNEKIKLAIRLKEAYGSDLDFKVFNENAIQLLNNGNLKDVALKCDEYAIKEYLEKLKQIEEAKNDKDTDNKLFNEITTRSNSVQIIYLGEKKYIKYIDNNNELHLVQAYNSEKVSNYYRDKIASLGPDEKLDPEAFFTELSQIATEENLTPTNEIDKETQNFDVQRMVKFVETSDKLGAETEENIQEKETMLHSDNGEIHAIKETNDIVYTEDKVDHVNADIIRDGQSYTDENATQQNTDLSDNKMTAEEYQELCNKFVDGTISEDEMRRLKAATPDYYEDNPVIEEGPSLTMGGQKKQGFGFANKTMLIYIIMIVAFIGIFIGAMIFSMTN